MESFSNFLCFQLGATARKIQKYYNAKYSEHGVTVAQSFILFSLLENDGLSVKKLAELLEIDSSAITGLVDRLEKEQLVRRTVNPADRRAFRILLTAKGKTLAEKILSVAMEFNENLKNNLTAKEIAGLKSFFNSLEVLEI